MRGAAQRADDSESCARVVGGHRAVCLHCQAVEIGDAIGLQERACLLLQRAYARLQLSLPPLTLSNLEKRINAVTLDLPWGPTRENGRRRCSLAIAILSTGSKMSRDSMPPRKRCCSSRDEG